MMSDIRAPDPRRVPDPRRGYVERGRRLMGGAGSVTIVLPNTTGPEIDELLAWAAKYLPKKLAEIRRASSKAEG